MRILGVSMCMILLWGCSSGVQGRHSDPAVLVIRNSSGAALDSVVLREADTGDGLPARLGAVSPVPRGSSQEFHRPSKAKPLPDRALVAWQDMRGTEFSVTISLKEVLAQSTGESNESLVIEIRPDGKVASFLERL